MSTKKEILHLITNGETKKAINTLLEIASSHKKEVYQEVALQSAKYEQFKREERSGIQNMEYLEVKLSPHKTKILAI